MPAEPETLADCLRWAAARLPGETPRLDAETLLAAALGRERLAMLLERPAVGAGAMGRFRAMVARRQAREPVALIVGQREFWSLRLKVTAQTLVPRPESETLVAAALQLFPEGQPLRVLDLGTGSGALLLALLAARPLAFGVAVDRSPAALQVARGNAVALGLSAQVAFLCGDWGASLAGVFDLVLCNPPYVEEEAVLAPELSFEPAGALFAGADGLAAYRRIVPQLPGLLGDGGVALLELGAGQAPAVAALAAEQGLTARTHPDLAGIARVLQLSREIRTKEGLARGE